MKNQIYYRCLCENDDRPGCIITAETMGRFTPEDPSDRADVWCPQCGADLNTFILCDPPTTNEVWVDRIEDLQTHIQGEEERP